MVRQRATIRAAAGQIEARLMNEADATCEALDRVIAGAAAQGARLLVLPECAYPAYLIGSVQSYRSGGHMDSAAFLAWLAQRAARHRLHIVCGFVEDNGEALHNAAVLLDDHGRELGRSRKRFLWNADLDWYEPGTEIQAFDTSLGRIGIAICAETRVPEILATLAADGAGLIAMPTCWINGARDPGHYFNPQVAFLVEARAREFGLPFVCADKFGLEMAATGYVGQSRIVRADGTLAAAAPPTGETVVVADIAPGMARRVWLTDAQRRRLAGPAVGLASPSEPRRVRLAAVPQTVVHARPGGAMGDELFEPLRRQGVALAVINVAHEAQAERLGMLANAFDLKALTWPDRLGVFEAGPARVAVLPSRWVHSFVAARIAALDGAEVLAVFDMPEDLAVLRTRALENRIYVIAAGATVGAIIGPDGEVLDEVPPGESRQAVAEVDLNRALDKCVAPGTDIFAQRRPEMYRY